MTALKQFKRVCHKHLVMSDDSYLDVVFGAVIANRLDSTPVWLYLVGPPSSGKTEVLRCLTGNHIYQLDKLTRKTLVSGWQDPKERKRENSLLPLLDGKVMVIKDFTAMIHDRKENLLDTIGQLRAASDGYYTGVFGTGKSKTFVSKFGIIAGVTNVIDKHRGLLAELGERFLTYRCPDVSDEEATLRCLKVLSKAGLKQQQAEMTAAATKVLQTPLHKVILSDSFKNKIIEIAKFVAVARCEVVRNPYSKEPEIPIPEVPTRLTRQLCDLAVGIAIIQGRRYVTKDIQQLVQKTALDSLTLKRLRLLKVLYTAFPSSLSTNQVTTAMRYSESIVRRWLEDLHLLDLITQEVVEKNKTLWKIRNKSILKQIWS